MTIRCLAFRPFAKKSLVGFADLHLVRTGIIIRDCCLHQRDGKQWIAFPARGFEDRDGNAHWASFIEFAADAKEARASFQRQAVAAVRAVIDKREAA